MGPNYCKFLAARRQFERSESNPFVNPSVKANPFVIRQALTLPPAPPAQMAGTVVNPPLPRLTVPAPVGQIPIVKIPIGKIPIVKIPIAKLPTVKIASKAVAKRTPKQPPSKPPPHLLLKAPSAAKLTVLKDRLYLYKLTRNISLLAKAAYDIYELPQERHDRIIAYMKGERDSC